ncbi:T-cell receptor beta chain V region 3H.25 [Myotis davidii]|nr:T-cell receptor beta chain V region 3H.25 [Myotis davidii]
MGPRLLHCVALCLLGVGYMGAMVTQNPRYQVTRMGKPVTLSCSQGLNHDLMYWYQQKLSQAPKLLFYYYDKDFNNETDTSDNFQPSRPNTSFCSLRSVVAEVTQTPGHLTKGKGQNVKMYCVPKKGHDYVFWYRQILKKEFKFVDSFQYKIIFEAEMPKERFSAEYPQNSACILETHSTELQDSAMYLCPSSEHTVLNISEP